MSDEKYKTISNLKIFSDRVIVLVNPKIYQLSIVYSACYVFLDKAYVVLSGDPDKEIFVELRYKSKKGDLERLGRDFNNELLNYAVYLAQSEKTSGLREQVVSQVLSTNSSTCSDDEFDDPLGIAKPWSEDSQP